MKFFLFISLFIVFSFKKQEEKYPFSKWDETTKTEANSAKDISYYSDLEKEVIYLINLVRLNPDLFSKTYLQEYTDNPEFNIVRISALNSLKNDLKKAKKVSSLVPQEDLFQCAKQHVLDTGKKGLVGHQNYSKRFKQFASKYGATGENCDYGNDTAIDIVINLLIDEDVSGYGHRKNILNKNFLSVGVKFGDHKKYGTMCVMDFGDK
jgi:uncharacterized protein YkwD